MYIHKLIFTWDTNKASTNRMKHSVSFEEAASVFVDPDALDWADDQHSDKEQRYKRIGNSLMGVILIVVYTIRRDEHEEEKIRIISARQASRKERTAYYG